MANLIKRSNQMNESHYRLKEVTQRVLALAIEQAQHIGIEKVLAGTKTIVVADYYAKVYGTSTQAAYEALKIAVDDMYYSEYVWQEIDDKGNINKYRSRFVSHIGYLGGQGAIEFVLTEKAREHILNLTKNFTLYEIKQLTYLGKYGIRLYELLAQWRSVGKVEFSLEEIRTKLGLLLDEYTYMSNFKKRVLDFAVEEINEHTDFSVRYEQIKQGKTITGFLFKFKLKPKQAQIASETLKTTSDSLNTIKPLTEPQIAKYSMILCKLGSISDLAGTMDYPTFANWLGNILRGPKNSNQETVKRVFKTLRTETDYNSKT